MAKTRTLGSKTPFDFVAGREIRSSDLSAAIEQLQWAQEFNADYIVNDMGRYKYVMQNTVTDMLYFPIYINTDIQTIEIRIRTYAPDYGVGLSNRFRITIGSATTVNFTCNNANAGALQSSTVATSSSGTGFQFVTCTADTWGGGLLLARLDLLSLHGHRRTTIGDPPDA